MVSWDATQKFLQALSQPAEYGWYRENSEYQMHAVGELKPNAWGVYDMYGNAWELCRDWFSKAYYTESPKKNLQSPVEGEDKVSRGCAGPIGADDCRSSSRNSIEPDGKTRSPVCVWLLAPHHHKGCACNTFPILTLPGFQSPAGLSSEIKTSAFCGAYTGKTYAG